MKILFDGANVGFGNCGGSKTIMKCAEVLASFGHEVYVSGLVRYNWHKPKNIKFTQKTYNQKFDAAIACSAKDVPHTLVQDAKRKFYYIRGYEIWSNSKERLLSAYKTIPCITNSGWIYNMLKSNDIKSKIIYPGLDFDIFYNMNEKRSGFGAIYHTRHRTKNHDFALKLARKTKIDIKLLNKDIIGPTEQKLNKWYNKLLIWFAPSQNDALHIPPQEASLSGCALLCSDHPQNGTYDYAIDRQTCLVYKHNDINMALEYLKELASDESLRKRLNNNMVDLLRTKIGSRQRNMKEMERCLENGI